MGAVSMVGYTCGVMKIALIGATGMIGSRILAEAAARGHEVTAICRHPEKIEARATVTAVAGDVFDTAALAKTLAGHDVVVHSYNPAPDAAVRAMMMAEIAAGRNPMAAAVAYRPADEAGHQARVQTRIDEHTRGTQSILDATRQAGVKRIAAVGGAGTLMVNGQRVMDGPGFPRAFEGGAKSTAVVKEILRGQTDVEWTVLCPPMSIEPGGRTGQFRLGGDDLMAAADGSSRISAEDYAVAMVDELEQPRHSGHRFTLAY